MTTIQLINLHPDSPKDNTSCRSCRKELKCEGPVVVYCDCTSLPAGDDVIPERWFCDARDLAALRALRVEQIIEDWRETVSDDECDDEKLMLKALSDYLSDTCPSCMSPDLRTEDRDDSDPSVGYYHTETLVVCRHCGNKEYLSDMRRRAA